MKHRAQIPGIILMLTVASLHAAPIVYEGFQYAAVGDELIGQPDDPGVTDVDAVGLSGTWDDASPTSGDGNDMYLKPGNLSFGDLATNGNHIGFANNLNNDTYHRTLTTNAQSAVSGAGEIWFSILFEKLQNNFSAGEGGFAFANQVVGNPRIFENGGVTPVNGLAGFGFGPTTAGNDLKPYAWDGTNIVSGDAAISVPPNNGNTNTDGSNLGPVHLLVGHIAFDSGAGGTDVYTLYDYELNDGAIAGGTLVAVASPLEVDVNQAALNTVNLTRQVNLNYDELRIGLTRESVVVPAESAPPTGLMLRVR